MPQRYLAVGVAFLVQARRPASTRQTEDKSKRPSPPANTAGLNLH